MAAHLSVVRKGEENKFEADDETVRPFRLYDPSEKKFYQYRNYSHLRNCHIGAFFEARWAKVGTTVEIVDVSKGRLIASYTRRVADIHFWGGDHIPKSVA